MDPVQEIKLRLSIEEVVGQYVPLKRAGHHLKGLCPFHSEKTPSFIVSPDKGIAYCFGCQKGGDIFRFVMEVEHLDFRGALEMLAEKSGVVLPDVRPEVHHEKTRILDLQKRAQEIFRSTLAGPDGGAAREALAKRGVEPAVADRFGIGAAPAAWDALAKKLAAEGVPEKDLVLAGLAVRRDEARDGVYDRFRSRLMFPLRDASGKVLAFTGRTLDGSEPKYLNSPESSTFSKGTFLYGIDLARDAIKKEGRAVLVEGQMDVVACHQFGLTNAVASSGTALTEHHLSALGKLARSVLFCYDGDTAGTAATLRGLQMAMNQGLSARVVLLEAGKDPDDAFRADRAATEASFAAPIAPVDFVLGVLRKKFDLTDAEQKRAAVLEYYAFVQGLTDPLAVEPLLLESAGVFGVRAEYFREGYEQFAAAAPGSYVRATPVAPDLTAPPRADELLVGLLLDDPGLLRLVRHELRGGEVLGAEARRTFDVLVRALEEHPEATTAEILAVMPDELRPRAEFLTLAAERHLGEGDRAATEAELAILRDRLLRDFVRRRNREIAAALKDADPDQQKLLTEELQELLRQQPK